MKFEDRKIEKALIIELEGFSTTETAVGFVDILKKEVSKVTTTSYSLIVDSTNLSAFKPDILPILEKCYQLYMGFGFKKIFIVNPKTTTARMQIQRIAKSSKFTGIFVDGLDKALDQAKSL